MSAIGLGVIGWLLYFYGWRSRDEEG